MYRMIADQIAGRIRAGDFVVGERLPSERELAEQLEVSRPSIREALIALEIEGYVEVRVGTGVYVTQPKVDGEAAEPAPAVQIPYGDIGPFELLSTRILIEPECAALAAQNAAPEQLLAIEQAANGMPNSTAPRLSDRDFHVAIAEASGNMALASTVLHLLNLRDSNEVLGRLEQHFVTTRVWEMAEAEHERIVAAIKAGDAMSARQAMYHHLTGIMDRLRKDIGHDDSVFSAKRNAALV